MVSLGKGSMRYGKESVQIKYFLHCHSTWVIRELTPKLLWVDFA